jgi:hypothetical protein
MSDIDPQRLCVAAHELGHYIAWRKAGIRIKSIRVAGTGTSVAGNVHIGRQKLGSPKQAHAYLVGILAGPEADQRWCQHNGLTVHQHTWAADMDSFAECRKHEWTRRTPDIEFRAAARRLVAANWREVVRLAPQLAQRGHL